MEEYSNKELITTLKSFEPEDIATLSDILKDLNEFDNFDNLTLKEIINGVNLVIEENENSKLSMVTKEINEKYLNKYIKYSEGDESILEKVVNIVVDPAFGGNDFAIKFIPDKQVIHIDETGLDLKIFSEDCNYSCEPIILYSFLECVKIISEEEYYKTLEKHNIILKK